jgi:hypothetical protein
MDPLAFLFAVINLVLVVAFYAERRGVFDVDDENSSPREPRLIRVSAESTGSRRQRGLNIVP